MHLVAASVARVFNIPATTISYRMRVHGINAVAAATMPHRVRDSVAAQARRLGLKPDKGGCWHGCHPVIRILQFAYNTRYLRSADACVAATKLPEQNSTKNYGAPKLTRLTCWLLARI
jgi:hypothetical protein